MDEIMKKVENLIEIQCLKVYDKFEIQEDNQIDISNIKHSNAF